MPTMKGMEQAMNHHIQMVSGLTTRTLNWKYQCIEDLVLKEGIKFRNCKLPKRFKKKPYKQCFRNCLVMMLDNEDLVYVEGIACWIMAIPMHHAWLVDIKNPKRVIDPTWDSDKGRTYIGIPFDKRYVSKVAIEKSDNFSILDDWKNKFKLLKKGLPKNAIHTEVYELCG